MYKNLDISVSNSKVNFQSKKYFYLLDFFSIHFWFEMQIIEFLPYKWQTTIFFPSTFPWLYISLKMKENVLVD